MTDPVALLPNLGAEEGDGWRGSLGQTSVRQMAWLWRWLFPASARWLGVAPDALAPTAPWPSELGDPPSSSAFPWLDEAVGGVPWLVTREAREILGPDAALPDPAVVAQVHDKAFAHRAAEASGETGRALAGLVRAYEPEALRHPEDFARELATRLAEWPTWTGRRFTLKPRFGSSARGRLAGDADTLSSPSLLGGLARLADRGGAMLEPWLQRRDELATQCRVEADGRIALVGSLRVRATEAGGLLGHRGTVDSRGRVFSESPFDERAREAAVEIVRAASDEGFRGPCGVDAFAFAGAPSADGAPPAVELRPVVELNARFTAGLVTVGLVRRALPRVREAIGLEPGRRCGFVLGLKPPASGREIDPGSDPWEDALRRAGPDARLLRLGPDDGSGVAASAALLFAPSDADIDAALAGARESGR